MKKIFAVSLIAMAAVTSANAAIVAESMLGEAGHYGTKTGQITVQNEIATKQDKLGSGNVVAGTKTGNVVTSVTASNGTVTINKASGSVKDVDVASDAAISTAKSAIPSGWTNTQTATNLAAGDTVSAALGKLEKQIETKQGSGSYVTANGDITSSGDSYKIVKYDRKGLVTAGKSLEAADIPTLTTAKISGLDDALGDKQAELAGTKGNLVTYGDNDGSVTETEIMKRSYNGTDATVIAENGKVPSVSYMKQVVADNVGNYVEKQYAAGSNGVIVRNSAGIAMKATGSDVSVSNAGELTVKHSKTADQIPVLASAPSGTAESGYAFLWVE